MRGAIAALGRQGSRSLSMSDVALAANVSRATLYRYFPTKATVLEAVSEYISTTFLRGAERIAREVTDPMERLKAIMSLQLKLGTEDFITRITEVEPGSAEVLVDHYATSRPWGRCRPFVRSAGGDRGLSWTARFCRPRCCACS